MKLTFPCEITFGIGLGPPRDFLLTSTSTIDDVAMMRIVSVQYTKVRTMVE